MSYTMRFISTDDTPFDLSAIEAALKEEDPLYAITERSGEGGSAGGLLTHDGASYAELSVDGPGDLLRAELDALREELAPSRSRKRKVALDCLDRARKMLAVRALWQDRDTEETLCRIDPLWTLLFERHEGLVYADEEGYYDRGGLVVKSG